MTRVDYVDSVIDLIGDTPLVRLGRVTAPGTGARVLAKIEYFNPGGSVKDRIAVRMVDAAEAEGLLRPGGTIVEPTSGNTGVGLALVAQQRGYHCVFVCPDKVSEDKRNVLKAYGAEVVVCPTAVEPDHPDSYYSVSDRLARDIEGGWKPDQYSNPNNPLSHYETTGPELWKQTDGRITHFVAGSAPAERSAAPVATSRRSARAGCRWSAPTRWARSTPAAAGGRTWSRAWARTSGPRRTTPSLRPHHRGLRRRRVRDDPSAGPGGGAARRRLVRHGGRGGGAAGRRAPGRRRRGRCCCRTAAAAT